MTKKLKFIFFTFPFSLFHHHHHHSLLSYEHRFNGLTLHTHTLYIILTTVLYQKRYNRDRKYRFKLQKQIEEEYEKHNRLEEILKKSGTTDTLKKLAGE